MSLTEQITNAVHAYLEAFEKGDLDAIMRLYV